MKKFAIAIAIFCVAAIVYYLENNKQPQPPLQGGPMSYTVHDVVANQDYQHQTFDDAIASHGFTAEPPNETYILTSIGCLNFDYEVTYGQQSGSQGWFTEYTADNPTHKNFSTQQAMKDHLKSIDNAANGML